MVRADAARRLNAPGRRAEAEWRAYSWTATGSLATSPNVSSIRRFIFPEHLWPWQENDEWQVHSVYHWQHKAVDRDRIQLMANQVRELFGAIPGDLETFALASQITQAEAKEFFPSG